MGTLDGVLLMPPLPVTRIIAICPMKLIASPFENSCANHGGSGLAAVQQWDAKTKSWSMITDYMGSDRAIIDKLIAEDSNKYAAEQKIAERCN